MLNRRLRFWASACCALALCASVLAPTAGAATLKGKIEVDATGFDLMPGGITKLPLKQIRVYLGALEQASPSDAQGNFIESFYLYQQQTRTNDDGEYTFDLGNYPPRDMVVVVTLWSPVPGVQAYDQETDPGEIACLGSRKIEPNQTGETRVDIALSVRPRSDIPVAAYSIAGIPFRPTRDALAPSVYGKQPRCTVKTLGPPADPNLPVTVGYDARGITNVLPDRFAHIAVHYARAYDAYAFVKDGWSRTLETVFVKTWDAAAAQYGMAYQCWVMSIIMDGPSSNVLGPNRASAVFNMRHEYGHHFMCASPIAGSDSMPPYAPGDTGHDGLLNSNSTDAWTEGFATYFAAAVAEFRGEPKPYLQDWAGGRLNLAVGDAMIDDPVTPGEQLTYGELAEEFALASTLWNVSAVASASSLIDSLVDSQYSLETIYRVYQQLSGDTQLGFNISSLPCSFPDTGAVLLGVECLFIETGFYHDLNGDGLYGPGEDVGRTRWPLQSRGAGVYREHVPAITGSTLRLRAVDAAGQPIGVEGFTIGIQYDPPFESENSTYTVPVDGIGPYEFPIAVPGKPSRAIVTPIVAGLELGPPLVIESSVFHDRINPFRAGGVSPILAEHTFRPTGSADRFQLQSIEPVPSDARTPNPGAYPYRVVLQNNGPPVPRVKGIVTSSDPYTVVVDGVVRFKNVPENSSVRSLDTFKIRQSPDHTFDPASLSVDFVADP